MAVTVKYHILFVREGHRLPDPIHFLQSYWPKALKHPSANGEKELQSVLDMVCGEILLEEEDDRKAQSVPSGSIELDPPGPAVFSGQLSTLSRTKHPDRDFRIF